MKFEIEIHNDEPMVSSKNIADEFERKHSDVIASIKGVISEREFTLSDYIDTRGKTQPCLLLNERSALIAMPFIGGTKSKEGQRALVDAYLAYRDNNQPKLSAMQILSQMALEIDAGDKRQAALEKQLDIEAEDKRKMKEIINNKFHSVSEDIHDLQINSRNGVPLGYLSKSQAHRLYGLRFAEKAFHKLMAGMAVPTKRYVHTEADHTSFTTAYDEDAVVKAVGSTLCNMVQVSKFFGESPLVPGVRFKYTF